MKKLPDLLVCTVLLLSTILSIYQLFQLKIILQQNQAGMTTKQKLISELINFQNQLKSLQQSHSSTQKFSSEYSNQRQKYLGGVLKGGDEGKAQGSRKISFFKKGPKKLQQNDDPTFEMKPAQLKFPPKYKQFLKNFQHFYEKNQINKIGVLYCDWVCRGRLKERMPLFSSEQVVYFQKLQNLLMTKDQFQWAIIYAQSNKNLEQAGLEQTIKEISEQKIFKGITLIWKNQFYYRQSKPATLFQILKKNGWYYQQMQSLHLRTPQGKIVFIFTQKQAEKSKRFKLLSQPPLNKVAVMIQFIMRQNIPYMREFIIYHINIGVSKIFLYDNSGVAGFGLSTAKTNKYGFDMDCIIDSEEQMIKKWEDIWETFKDYIVYVPYQPVDENDQIIYNQMSCFSEYITIFQDVTEYTFFTDADQFIVKPDSQDLYQYLKLKSNEGCGCVKFTQQKFLTRFCYKKKRIIQMDKFIQLNATNYANKNVCENRLFIAGNTPHKQFVKSKQTCWVPPNQLKFHHYNTEREMIYWMFGYTKSPPSGIQSDTSFMKHKQLMDEACQGKCSQNYEIGCGITQNTKLCPFDFKVQELSQNN